MSHRESLRILCFGASLVRGHTEYGMRATPYSIWMKQKLEAAGKKDVQVEVDGVSGAMVTANTSDGYKNRMGERSTEPAQTLRILCFGDSLTEGYTRMGQNWTPYSEELKVVLEERGDNGLEIDVFTEGRSGELASAGGFLRRMETAYSVNSTDTLYDWVLILGGTNDLGWGRPVLDIFDALIEVSEIPLSNDAKVLMMTVPECQHKSAKLDARRDELNGLIKSDTRENLYVFDLHSKMPYHSLTEDQKDEIWDDGLHFTSKGYEMMGELVAERLLEIMKADKAASGTGEESKG